MSHNPFSIRCERPYGSKPHQNDRHKGHNKDSIDPISISENGGYVKRISNLAWSLIVLVFAFCIAGPDRAYAATIVVNSLTETVANDNVCTLREAIVVYLSLKM